jgi:hypothetical protein
VGILKLAALEFLYVLKEFAGGKDTAGAGTISPIPSRVFVENCPIALVGNAITSHGDSPHAAAVTATAQTRVFSST